MAYRNILVHLDQTARSDQRFRLALNLAKRHQARVDIFYATSMPYLGLQPERGLRDQVQADCIGEAERAGVEICWLSELEGMAHQPLAARLGYQTFFADLTLVGQPGPEAGAPPAPPRDLPERLVLTSGRPILTIPFSGEFNQVGSRVMVAWRSGRASARAVYDAMPLLQQAEAVNLVSFITSKSELHQAQTTMAKLSRFLVLHNIVAETEVRLISGIGFGDALLNRAAEEATDLLVAGGALPSARAPMANQLLKEMTVPVLMSS